MIAHARIVLVCLWMTALLSASVGVSVHQVYCYCLGSTTVSFFAAEEDCQASHIPSIAGGEANCCSKALEQATHSCCQKTDPKEKDCTKKTTRVFQLKTEFEVAKPDFKKLDFPKNQASVVSLPVYTACLPSVRKTVFQVFERPPPVCSGRMICVRHGVFRC